MVLESKLTFGGGRLFHHQCICSTAMQLHQCTDSSIMFHYIFSLHIHTDVLLLVVVLCTCLSRPPKNILTLLATPHPPLVNLQFLLQNIQLQKITCIVMHESQFTLSWNRMGLPYKMKSY